MSDEIYNQILWLESLRDVIESGDIETALATVEAGIKLLRKG